MFRKNARKRCTFLPERERFAPNSCVKYHSIVSRYITRIKVACSRSEHYINLYVKLLEQGYKYAQKKQERNA